MNATLLKQLASLPDKVKYLEFEEHDGAPDIFILSIDTRSVAAISIIPTLYHRLDSLIGAKIFVKGEEVSDLSVKNCPSLESLEVRLSDSQVYIPLSISKCESLETLELRGKMDLAPIVFDDFPKLNTLSLSNLRLHQVEESDSSVDRIQIFNCLIEHWDFLPKGLRVLEIGNTDISKLDKIPASVTQLSLRGVTHFSAVDSFFSETLRNFSFTGNEREILNVSGVPSLLDTTSFENTILEGSLTIDSGLKLTISDCELGDDFKLKGDVRKMEVRIQHRSNRFYNSHLPFSLFENINVNDSVVIENCLAPEKEVSNIKKFVTYPE